MRPWPSGCPMGRRVNLTARDSAPSGFSLLLVMFVRRNQAYEHFGSSLEQHLPPRVSDLVDVLTCVMHCVVQRVLQLDRVVPGVILGILVWDLPSSLHTPAKAVCNWQSERRPGNRVSNMHIETPDICQYH